MHFFCFPMHFSAKSYFPSSLKCPVWIKKFIIWSKSASSRWKCVTVSVTLLVVFKIKLFSTSPRYMLVHYTINVLFNIFLFTKNYWTNLYIHNLDILFINTSYRKTEEPNWGSPTLPLIFFQTLPPWLYLTWMFSSNALFLISSKLIYFWIHDVVSRW